MENYKTFAEMEAILLTAMQLPGRSIKDISAATGIKVNTLYKWKTTKAHLSPQKADKLLLYFMQNEPKRLELADTLLTAIIINTYLSNSSLSSFEGSTEEGD